MTADLLALDIFSADAAGRAGVSTFELKQAVKNGTVLRLKRGWYTGQRPQWPSDRHRLRVQIEWVSGRTWWPATTLRPPRPAYLFIDPIGAPST